MAARRRPVDLPLAATPPGRLLPWSIAALVWLAVISFGVAALADRALQLPAARGKLATVTLPAAPAPAQAERAVERVLGVLREAPGVAFAAPVPVDELERLLEPWFGVLEPADALPLPRLVDVVFDPAAEPALDMLRAGLQDAVPGTTLAVEAGSRASALPLAGLLRAAGAIAGASLVAGMVALAAGMIRTSLEAQVSNIELLRTLGAPDSRIARQCTRFALVGALRGGGAGGAFGLASVAILLYTLAQAGVASPLALDLRLLDWSLLAGVPLVSIVLVSASAHLGALWTLGRIA